MIRFDGAASSPAPVTPGRAIPVVAILSGAALAWEVLLIRIFSIVSWAHFAAAIISLALLGYAAGGTLLAIWRRVAGARPPRNADAQFAALLAAAAIAFGATVAASLAVALRLPFNPLEIVWNPRQTGWLLVLYLVLAVPFVFVAFAIGLTLDRFHERSGSIYAADLAGAAAGAVAPVVLLEIVAPLDLARGIAATGAVAGAVAAILLLRRRAAVAALAAAVIVAAATAAYRGEPLELRMSEFKDLRQALRIPGAAIETQRSSALSLLSTVASPAVPPRHAPGLSLGWIGELPNQKALFVDGFFVDAVPDAPVGEPAFDYLRATLQAAPYHVRSAPPDRVAVAGAQPTAIASAAVHGARSIDVVDPDAHLVEELRRRLRIGGPASVSYDEADVRSWAESSRTRYDVIELATFDRARSPDRLFTVESLRALHDRLTGDGWLATVRPMQLPGHDILKLAATAAEALRSSGKKPAEHLAVIRSWSDAALLVKGNPITAADAAALRAFAAEWSFDIAWMPGLLEEETNRYNLLDAPWLYDGFAAAVSSRDAARAFARGFKFDIAPPTDDRPSFTHFVKWRSIPELLQLRGRGGAGLFETGFLFQLAALAQAIVAAVVFVLLPMFLLRSRRAAASGPGLARLRIVAYFASLGLAFLFTEIAFINYLSIFLGHPLHAVAFVIGSFLLFAGAGSRWSQRADARRREIVWRAPLAAAVLSLAAIAAARLLLGAIAWPDPVRYAAALAVVAPLAFAMGMPFPLGLRYAAGVDPRTVPWAWAINGAASVVSAVAASLMAAELGFTAVVAAAAALYLAAAVALRSGFGGTKSLGRG
jgi:hypothetical protein